MIYMCDLEKRVPSALNSQFVGTTAKQRQPVRQCASRQEDSGPIELDRSSTRPYSSGLMLSSYQRASEQDLSRETDRDDGDDGRADEMTG